MDKDPIKRVVSNTSQPFGDSSCSLKKLELTAPVHTLTLLNSRYLIITQADQILLKDLTKDEIIFKKEEVFKGQRVHGVVIESIESKPNSWLIFIYGGKFIRLIHLEIDEDNIYYEDSGFYYELADWILTIQPNFISHNEYELTIGFSHHFITSISVKIDLFAKAYSFNWLGSTFLPLKCLLYSTKFLGDNKVASGTIFNEVLIWKYDGFRKEGITKGCLISRCVGHEGVIFGLDHNPKTKLLLSTSDDRTIRTWDLNSKDLTLSPKSTIFGHQSRVWKAKFFKSEFVISISEDATAKLFKILDSDIVKCMTTFKSHNGKNIWTLENDEINDRMLTGGNDGAVLQWDLRGYTRGNNDLNNNDNQGNISKNILPLEIPNDRNSNKKSYDTFWTFKLINLEHLLTLTKNGNLILNNTTTNTKRIVYAHDDLMNYSILTTPLEVRDQGNGLEFIVGVGSKSGMIHLLKYKENREVVEVKTIQEFNSRIDKLEIFNLGLENEYCLLSKSINGSEFKIFKVSFEKDDAIKLLPITTLSIPNNFFITSMGLTILPSNELSLALGSRSGSLTIYTLPNAPTTPTTTSFQPIYTHANLHSKETITSLHYPTPTRLMTCSRDGRYSSFKLHNDNAWILLNQSKITKGWIERITHYNGEVYFISFHAKELRIIDLKSGDIVVSLDTLGGVSRAWDLVASSSEEGVFGFVSGGKSGLELEIAKRESKMLKRGYGGRELRAACWVDNRFIVVGGEDGYIRLLDSNGLVELDKNRAMGGVILGLSIVKFSENILDSLIFSCGANENLMVFKIMNVDSSSEEQTSFVLKELASCPKVCQIKETRIMSTTTLPITQTNTLILTAYSDGTFRFWLFNTATLNFSLIYYGSTSPLKAILTTHCIGPSTFGNIIYYSFIVGTTGGELYLYNLNCRDVLEFSEPEEGDAGFEAGEIQESLKILINQSGVNCIASTMEDDYVTVFTGGEDGALNNVKLKLRLKEKDNDLSFEILGGVNKCQSAHVSAVQGLEVLVRNNEIEIYSISLDLRLSKWKLNYDDDKAKLSLADMILVDVHDPAALKLNFKRKSKNEDDKAKLLLVGMGIQSFEV